MNTEAELGQYFCANTQFKKFLKKWEALNPAKFNVTWLDDIVSGREFVDAVVRALDLRLEVAGLIPAAALSNATFDKLFTHIVQRLWRYNLMARYKSV